VDDSELRRALTVHNPWGKFWPGEAEDGNDLPYSILCTARQSRVDDSLHNTKTVFRVGKKAAGRMLDGQTWDEYPEIHAHAE
jgi:hypothetical protein